MACFFELFGGNPKVYFSDADQHCPYPRSHKFRIDFFSLNSKSKFCSLVMYADYCAVLKPTFRWLSLAFVWF
jgi:hypothetical protein